MSLVRELVRELINDKVVTAVYGGGFKPPTAGHLLVVKKALEQFPEIDKLIIYVGGGVRDEIDQEESLLVWEKYKKLLPSKVEIQPSKAPIGDILRYAKENTEEVVYFVIGAREGNEGDLADVKSRTMGVEEKYPNTRVKVIQTPGTGMSGTNARKALKTSPEDFYQYLPQELSTSDKEEIYNILRPASLKEDMSFEKKRELVKKIITLSRKAGDMTTLDKLADMIAKQIEINPPRLAPGEFKVIKENATYSSSIDIIEKCAQLTNYMKELGMPIEPVPAVEFVDGDTENAKDFFGKTAYYDPNEKKIVLYTEGRHPKDIVRSFAHEMIHHMQNLDGRLGPITTTNTQEDDHLNDIEAEANLKGTMTFRNWTDSLQENKDPFDLLEGLLNEGRYDKFVNQLSRLAFELIKDGHDVGRKVVDETFRVGPADEDPDIVSDDFEFDFAVQTTYTDDLYKVDGGANAGFDDEGEEIQPLLAVKFHIPKNPDWQKVSFDIKDVVRHELEHLTQDGENVKGVVIDPKDPKLNRPGKQMSDDQFLRNMIDIDLLSKADYFKLEKEIDAMMQGLYFKAKKSKRPYREVIDDYLATQPINAKEKEEILNLWRSRNKALNLPMFESNYKLGKILKEEETEQKYKIFCDMDGVLTDFDEQFKRISGGVSPRQYEETNGKSAFWTLIDGGGVGYWVGMPWMPNGKKLWDYISKYNPIILSAPSKENESRLGKRLWVRNNLSPKPKVVLASAQNKQNYSGTNRILIDDRPSNVEQWRSKGGIGILFISTEQTIKDLQKLGL